MSDVLIGGVLALAGSFGATLLTHFLNGRSSERRERREAETKHKDRVREQISVFLQACNESLDHPIGSRPRRDPVVLHTQLALSLGPNEEAIEDITAAVATELNVYDGLPGVAIASAQNALPGWFHGRKTAEETLAAFVSSCRNGGMTMNDRAEGHSAQ